MIPVLRAVSRSRCAGILRENHCATQCEFSLLSTGRLVNVRSFSNESVADPPKPTKFSIGGAVDEMLGYDHRGKPMFPEYMHKDLRKRTIINVKHQVNSLKAQKVKVSREVIDDILVDTIQREGSALATSEEDRAHIVCPEAPMVGDEVDMEGRKAQVVNRFTISDGIKLRLCLEACAIGPDGKLENHVMKSIFDVVGSEEPEETKEEAEHRRTEMLKREFENRLKMGTGARAPTEKDIDRILHEDLMGTEMKENMTDEERKSTIADMEHKMFQQIDNELDDQNMQEYKAHFEALRQAKQQADEKPEQ